MSEDQLIPTPSIFGENNNFLLEREMGRGGMGGVYMGRDKMLERPVAVKVMLKEYGSDPEFVEKFKKEAQAAARLIHPNIAQIYSYGIASGMPYIAMELVAGGSLDQVMRNAGAHTDIPRVVKICEQVAQALRCAADQGFVHGDVKPENVLLDSNGNAKLVDFGLAAMQKDTTEIWGTPYYIAPEKVKKEPVDYRADMYSLGGTLYHAICGVAPFEGDDATAVVRKRFEAPPLKPSQVRPGVSPQVDFLVMKMLALNPADRYPTFEALLEDFKKVMASGLSTTTTLSSTGLVPGLDGVRGRRIRFKTRRLPTAESPEAASGDADGKNVTGEQKDPDAVESAESSEAPESGETATGTSRRKGFKANLSAAGDRADDDEGGAGGKVAAVVGGVIGAILIVVGGLFWYQASAKKAREAEELAGLNRNSQKARSSLEDTRSAAIKLADSKDTFAEETLKACRKYTKDLEDALSERYADSVLAMLHPAPTKELLDAIASTNVAAKAAAPAKPAAQAPAAQPRAAAAAAQRPLQKFRPPTGDEADPNSPEGKQYLEDKAKWEAAQKAGTSAPQTPAAVAASPQGGVAAKGKANKSGKLTEPPKVVKDMADLWTKAYSCKASAIRIRKAVTDLVAEIDEVSKMKIGNAESLQKFVDKSNGLVGRFNEIKDSKDATSNQNSQSFINERGKNAVNKALSDLRQMKIDEDRKKAEEEKIRLEKERLARLAREKAELIAQETARAKETFDKIVADGKIRQLDWRGAIRMLEHLELKTAEGELARDFQKRKINCMKKMQDILVQNMKGYTFTRGCKNPKFNLKGAMVTEVDTQNITIQKKGAPKSTKISWQTFCGQSPEGNYHSSLDELITRFIVKSGSVPGTKKLSKLDQFEAISGVAFILQIVCADDATAMDYSVKLVKEVVKEFPEILKTAKEFFPDIDFSDVASDVASEQI